MSIRYFLSRQNLVRTIILFVLSVFIGVLLVYLRGSNNSDSSRLPRQAATLPRATWFVSPKGSDRNDGRSRTKAFATVQKALDSAQPGQAVQLMDGTYAQSFHTVRDGSKDKPITIMGSRKAEVTGARSRVIEIHHDYVRLTGFRINGHFGGGETAEDYRDKLIYAIGKQAKDGVEGLKLDHLLIENAGGECVRLRYFAKYNEISDVTIKNCGLFDFRFNDGGKNGEGIYIGTAPEQLKDGKNPTADPDESSDNWVHHNYIETNGNECVDVKEAAHDNLIEHNECTGQLDPESGGMDARGDKNTFRHNKIYGNVGSGVRLGGDEDEDGVDNEVYKNTISDNEGNGIKILRSPQGKICDNDFSDNKKDDLGGEYGEDMSSPESCES